MLLRKGDQPRGEVFSRNLIVFMSAILTIHGFKYGLKFSHPLNYNLFDNYYLCIKTWIKRVVCLGLLLFLSSTIYGSLP